MMERYLSALKAELQSHATSALTRTDGKHASFDFGRAAGYHQGLSKAVALLEQHLEIAEMENDR